MSIPPDLAAEFAPQVRARGEEYQRAGRVELLGVEDARVEALVQGSMPYSVELRRRKDGVVTMSCSCPYGDEWGEACKHLWATILELEEMDHPLLSEGEPSPGNGKKKQMQRAPRPQAWRKALQRLKQERTPYGYGGYGGYDTSYAEPAPAEWPARRRLAYVVDGLSAFGARDGIVVELATRPIQSDGTLGPPKRFAYSQAQWLAVPDETDREIAQMLLGAPELNDYGYSYGHQARSTRRFRIAPSAFDTTLRRICETGRCHIRLRADEADPAILAWDDGDRWELRITLAPHGNDACRVEGALARGDERVPLTEPVLLLPGLAVLRGDGRYRAAPVNDYGAHALAHALRGGTALTVTPTDAIDLVGELSALYPRLPAIELPAWLGVRAVRVAPTPRLLLRPMKKQPWQPDKMDAALSFDYDGVVVEGDAVGNVAARPDAHLVVQRDRAAEAAALARLEAAGFKRDYDYNRQRHVRRISSKRAPRVAMELSAEGWVVELEGHAVRHAGDTSLAVRSGIDWFDLALDVDFGGVRAELPELLAALRRGERMVALPDGSVGILPDEWLARYGALAGLGAPSEAGVRFGRGQTALLDALLAAMPEARTDELFERAREELRRFEGVVPRDPPPGFTGELRPYQREGLGWLDALRGFGFGGVLADEMGLGKTIQALALLEMRREENAGASLVVVPRSLVFNWQQEAARFTPALRVLAYHGPPSQRRAAIERLSDYDLVLTTYGTLRRDAAEFKDVEFDYAILDEAQAIKNATTATAKAARLIRARHRLAMSGTPIENRLAELWSLFEFLTPGLLGASAAFQRLAKPAERDVGSVDGKNVDGKNVDAKNADGNTDGRAIIARAVRPFILRRTKAHVAPELPDRVEQTVWVDLGPAERRLYDELRHHYRSHLLGRIAREGLARSKMHVLEALLRLRQAACHPGLIDKARATDASSKLDVLLSRVTEVVATGHKALVFSQFTSMLAIVRPRLDAEGLAYEYLDGQTRDRKERVDRFQNDPSIPLFLISLKAGGLGLNLTAADYVFLLDPWWNPAVEAQAIDRAHRIGQARRVVAARLVARDTVEEKVLALQESKRELADAIIRADEGLVAKLTREELEGLLQ